MVQTRKLDKEKLNSRSKTGIYIGLYYLLLFIFAAFSDPRGKEGNGWTWWIGSSTNQYIAYTSAVFFIILLLPIVYLMGKELCSCFLKTNNKQIIITITTLIYLTQLIPTIVYMPFTYSNSHWHTSAWNLTYIFIGSSTLLPIISYFILLTIIKRSQHKTKFNIFWFPVLCIFVGWTFEWLQYLTLIRYWSTLFLLVGCVVGVDVFGYIFGSMFGKHQLSSVSPKKTWEGAIGGIITSTGIMLLLLYLFSFSPSQVCGSNGGDAPQGSFIGIQLGKQTTLDTPIWWISCTLIIIVIGCVSVLGDLMFSWIKRKNNIKDFSNILKEHGGVLDRIDALILVISFFGTISTIVAFIFSYINGWQTNLIFPTFNSLQ